MVPAIYDEVVNRIPVITVTVTAVRYSHGSATIRRFDADLELPRSKQWHVGLDHDQVADQQSIRSYLFDDSDPDVMRFYLGPGTQDDLVFKVLASADRRKILDLLHDATLTTGELPGSNASLKWLFSA